MIRYALVCAQGHAFDSWFANSAAYDKQVKRGLVDCPHCGNTKVEKQIMSPRLVNREDARYFEKVVVKIERPDTIPPKADKCKSS